MSRTRPLALLAALVVSVFVLAACGGDDKSGDDSAAYRTAAKAVVLSVRATGDSLGDVLSTADKMTDAALTQKLEAVQKLLAADLTSMEALEPPDDTATELVANLKTAYGKVKTDVAKLTDAATANDPTGAKDATAQLLADSPGVKAANNALGLSVGVAPRPDATPSSTETTDTTADDDATTTSEPTGDPAEFNAEATVVVNHITNLGNTIEKIIKEAGDKDDDTLSDELGDAEDEAADAIDDLEKLTPPTDEYEKLVGDLHEAMQAIDGDLGSLSSSVADHDAETAKTDTRKLLKDAPAVAAASEALSDSLRTS